MYGLTLLHHPAGDIYLTGHVGHRGRTVRVIIRATDVALALTRPRDLSIRTVLSATVASIGRDKGPLAAVSLASSVEATLPRSPRARRWTSFASRPGLRCLLL